MRYVLLLLAVASLLSLAVAGRIEPVSGRAAIAVVCPAGARGCPEGGGTATQCVNFDGETDAATLLISAFSSEYMGDGRYYFCMINGWGETCERADTWYFYVNGAPRCNDGCDGAVGASGYYPRDGDVLAFGWDTEGISTPSFDAICNPSSGGGRTPVKWAQANVSPADGSSGTVKYCVNSTINITVLYKDAPVWKPTYSLELGDVASGFVLRMVHKNFFWEFTGYLQTDENGNAQFTPTEPGEYEATITKSGFGPMTVSFEAEDCGAEGGTQEVQTILVTGGGYKPPIFGNALFSPTPTGGIWIGGFYLPI